MLSTFNEYLYFYNCETLMEDLFLGGGRKNNSPRLLGSFILRKRSESNHSYIYKLINFKKIYIKSSIHQHFYKRNYGGELWKFPIINFASSEINCFSTLQGMGSRMKIVGGMGGKVPFYPLLPGAW